MIDLFYKKLYEPAPASVIGWTRIVVLSILLFKFLSKDYSLFGYIPTELLYYYPADAYSSIEGYALFGFQWMVDLFSFHWIHWFISFPTEKTLWFLQRILMIWLTVTIIFGGGYKKLNYLVIYSIGMYLFGFLFRTGSDIDAIFILMQIVLLLFLFRDKETYLLLGKQQNPLNYSKENGWFFSMTLLIFIGYYFLSGITKIVDISLLDWSRFELANLSELYKVKQELGDDITKCYLRDFLIGNSWIDTLGTSLIYLEHLLIPILFFKRKYIPAAWFIYLFLHLGTLTVNILFAGVILSWLVFLPVHRFFQKVVIVWDGDCSFCQKSIIMAQKFDWFKRFIIINSNEQKMYEEYLEGWDKNINKGLWAKGKNSPKSSVGFDGFRRMTWVMPLLWPILPFLYIPFIPIFGRLVYNWIAKNRYRFGCNSSSCNI